ncbi:hypothetical protein AM586_26870 (plasmid) [Massilia sp. WG5]|nr:hypothetical protein AM586_26870 [Massilia sp. WG5]
MSRRYAVGHAVYDQQHLPRLAFLYMPERSHAIWNHVHGPGFGTGQYDLFVLAGHAQRRPMCQFLQWDDHLYLLAGIGIGREQHLSIRVRFAGAWCVLQLHGFHHWLYLHGAGDGDDIVPKWRHRIGHQLRHHHDSDHQLPVHARHSLRFQLHHRCKWPCHAGVQLLVRDAVGYRLRVER